MWMTVWRTQLRLGLFAGILPAHMTSAATFPTQWPSLSSPKTTQGELHPRLCISTLKQQGKLSCLWECSYHLFCPMTTSPHQFDSPLTTDVRDEREGWEHFQALTSAKKKKKSKYTPSLQNLARDQQVSEAEAAPQHCTRSGAYEDLQPHCSMKHRMFPSSCPSPQPSQLQLTGGAR